MAKVHYVKANKDYPEFKIEKGEMHYVWALHRQRTQRSKSRPPRSRLTNSEFKSTYYSYVDTDLPECRDNNDFTELASNVRTHAEEERGKIDNLPENFQNGPMGEKLETRAEELEAWADEIDEAATDLGDESDFSADDDFATYAEKAAAKVEELQEAAPDPE